jgi:hypothetical protein
VHFFSEASISKIKGQVWGLHKLGKCVFFFCWRLEIYLSLKLGGSTVWNLSPNRLRGDLTWGLPKLQIGLFNGLESQSKQVEK